MIQKILISLFVVVVLGSCSNAMDEFSRRPCFVRIDNATHIDATLASAMNAVSPGVFCMIRKTQSGGANYFSCSTNQGLSSDIKWTAIYERMSVMVGQNNGIIIGFGNLDNPAIFYAYDRECPNCFDPDAIPVRSKPLTMNDKGHATCAACGRKYDMNNRGYVIEGETGNPLTRYPASTTGPFGTLLVQ